MEHKEFVHLHNHTIYSTLDGLINIDRMIAKMKKDPGMKAVAITDHGNLYGAVDFYQKVSKAGFKPIIGEEFYITPGKMEDRVKGEEGYANHLVLLARNAEGYRNLCILSSAAFLKGFYGKPRIDKTILREHSKGLIALSACLKGEVAYKITMKRHEEARAAAIEYSQIFEPHSYYLEIQLNGIEEQLAVNHTLKEFSKELGIPLVATNDCHYLDASESQAHDVMLCISTGKMLNDTKRLRFDSQEVYFKTSEEMCTLFSNTPDALASTLEIAERCNFDMETDKIIGVVHYPKFEVPPEETLETQLSKISKEGLAKILERFKDRPDFETIRKTYEDRLDYELDIINKKNFAGYMLIVADYINWAKAQGIPVGPGRGSGAGSLIAYSTGITGIDPIEHKLLFERFLNPERPSFPDIDTDFCKNRRDEVVAYVTNKYGKDVVSQVGALQFIKTKNAIKDVGRIMDVPFQEMNNLSKLIDNRVRSVKEAVETTKELREKMAADRRIGDIVEMAKIIEGSLRQPGIHAAGIVISDVPLDTIAPLFRGKNGEVVTQYDKDDVEKIGLIKYDFLGLKNLTIIDDAVKLIDRNQGVKIDIDNLPLDDKDVYRFIGSGKTNGVFQLESEGMKQMIMKFKPDRFSDIVAICALYRPGPLGSGMVDTFIERKHGRQKIAYPHPKLESILEDTYGVIVYQEQVMQIASTLAGYTLGQADGLRKAMGKKIAEKMAEERVKFLKGAIANHVDEKNATEIFDLMEKFAEYGFNKSHSAAYAMIAYQTAYLKFHYPVEFLVATLTNSMDNTDDIVKYIAEARSMGITINPPDINKSENDFTIENGAIRFGLKAIKNIGSAVITEVLDQRRSGGEFTSIYDVARRVDLSKVNKKSFESLIKSSAMGFSGVKRSQLFTVIDEAFKKGSRKKDKIQSAQTSLFGDAPLDENGNEEEKYPEMEEWSENEILKYEKEMLGFYMTSHPLSEFADDIESMFTDTTNTLKKATTAQRISIAGIVSDFVVKKSKKTGLKFATFMVEDLAGKIKATAFPKTYEQYGPILMSDLPVIFTGQLQVSDDRDAVGGDDRIVESSNELLVNEVNYLSKAQYENIREMSVSFSGVGIGEDDVAKLKNAVTEFKGTSRVVVNIAIPNKGKIKIKLHDSFGVSPSKSLEKEIKTIIPDAKFSYVRVVPEGPKQNPYRNGYKTGNGNGKATAKSAA